MEKLCIFSQTRYIIIYLLCAMQSQNYVFIALFKHFISRCVSIFQHICYICNAGGARNKYELSVLIWYKQLFHRIFISSFYLAEFVCAICLVFRGRANVFIRFADLISDTTIFWVEPDMYMKKYYILKILDVFAMVLFWWFHRKKKYTSPSPFLSISCGKYSLQKTITLNRFIYFKLSYF